MRAPCCPRSMRSSCSEQQELPLGSHSSWLSSWPDVVRQDTELGLGQAGTSHHLFLLVVVSRCVRHPASSAGSLLLRDPLSRAPAVPCSSSSSTTYFLFLPAHITSLPPIWVCDTGPAQATNHRLLSVGAEELQAGQGGNQTRQAVVLSCPHPTAAGSVEWLNRNETGLGFNLKAWSSALQMIWLLSRLALLSKPPAHKGGWIKCQARAIAENSCPDASLFFSAG